MKHTLVLFLFALFTLQGCVMHDGYGRRGGGYERGDHDRRGGGDHDRRGGGDRDGGHERRH